jgi:hypothetical protein
MASDKSDKSEPRVGLILQVGVLAIVTLIATRAVLQAYFDRMERAEITRKIGTNPTRSSACAPKRGSSSTPGPCRSTRRCRPRHRRGA